MARWHFTRTGNRSESRFHWLMAPLWLGVDRRVFWGPFQGGPGRDRKDGMFMGFEWLFETKLGICLIYCHIFGDATDWCNWCNWDEMGTEFLSKKFILNIHWEYPARSFFRSQLPLTSWDIRKATWSYKLGYAKPAAWCFLINSRGDFAHKMHVYYYNVSWCLRIVSSKIQVVWNWGISRVLSKYYTIKEN